MTIRKSWVFAFIMSLTLALQGQVSIENINVVTLGPYANFSSVVVNNASGNALLDHSLTFTVKYAGQPVYQLVQTGQTLAPGTAAYGMYNVSSVSYYPGERGQLMNEFGWLAPGNYDVCIAVKDAMGMQLDEMCDYFEEPGNDEIELLLPDPGILSSEMLGNMLDFCWSSTLPSSSAISYLLEIFPKYAYQTDQDAVSSNGLLHSQVVSGYQLCAQVSGNILLSSGETAFAWRVKAIFSQTVLTENGPVNHADEIAVSPPAPLMILPDANLEDCYATPFATLMESEEYVVKSCTVLVDMDEFLSGLSADFSIIDQYENETGLSLMPLTENKRYYKLELPSFYCTEKGTLYTIKVSNGSITRVFKIRTA
jgi:hypothetical protein